MSFQGFVSRPDDPGDMEVKVVKSQGLLSSTASNNEATESYYSSEEVTNFEFVQTKVKKVSEDKQTVRENPLPKKTYKARQSYGAGRRGRKAEKVSSGTRPSQMKSCDSGQGKVTEVVQRKFVVRPPAPSPPPDCVELNNGAFHLLEKVHWTKVFSFLPHADLARCLSVCKAFYSWGMNCELWPVIDLSRKRICQTHIIGMVKRQPDSLKLDNVIMTQQQLTWLLARIPQLKTLSLSSCSWSTVSALCFSCCPLLTTLNLNWMLGLSHQHFRDLVTPPTDLRPGMNDVSRFHNLRTLRLAGTEIEDESLQLIPQHLTQLRDLDISYCPRVTNEGIKKLVEANNAVITKSLRVLDISGSRSLTNQTLDSLVKCVNLSVVKIHKCSNITAISVQRFPNKAVKFLK